MDLAGFAGAVRGIADRAEAEMAMVACEEGARDFLAILRVATPKRTGALADSETVTGPMGSGAFASAEVGPHKIYDRFRNDGGTIRVRHARVLTDGVSFFGKQVTQHGAHYMQKAESAGVAVVEQACRAAAARFISL